jgi:hypothetical protein
MSDPVLAEAIGTIDGVNDTFTTPVAYYPGTLWAYVNGVLVEQDGDEGPVELGGVSVRMREPPRTGDTLHFYFQTSAPTGAGFSEPPTAYDAIDLVPIAAAAIDLLPDGSSEGEDLGYVPGGYAFDLVPEGVSADDLVPIPLSAEEV